MFTRATLVIFSVIALLACGDDANSGTPTASENAEETPVADEAVTPVAEPNVEPEDAPAAERVETTISDHFPSAMSDHVSLPRDTETINLGGSDFRQMTGPRGASINGPWHSGFKALAGTPVPVAMYEHNPSGDEGEDCPSLETIIVAAGQVEIVAEQRASYEWEGDGPAYGEEIDLLIFSRGDEAGFYVRKRFDHGDDYTDLCAAFGAPDSAFDMTATGTLEQAKSLAASFLTARENL